MSEGERKIMYGVVKRSNTRSRLKKGSKIFCISARERERKKQCKYNDKSIFPVYTTHKECLAV